jgi:hypothetical protein
VYEYELSRVVLVVVVVVVFGAVCAYAESALRRVVVVGIGAGAVCATEASVFGATKISGAACTGAGEALRVSLASVTPESQTLGRAPRIVSQSVVFSVVVAGAHLVAGAGELGELDRARHRRNPATAAPPTRMSVEGFTGTCS